MKRKMSEEEFILVFTTEYLILLYSLVIIY